MLFLSDEARDDFLVLSYHSYTHKLISWSEFMSRLGVLNSLCGASENALLLKDDYIVPEPVDEEVSEEEWLARHQSRAGRHLSKQLSGCNQAVKPEGYLEFKYREWKFIKGDPDPLPSVPHGHWQTKHIHNLDAYQGHVFEKTKWLRRVSREEIILLWNDVDFRQFAREELDHFISNNPSFTWRVTKPRQIQSKRRLR